MLIEAFGPAGAGKTFLLNKLAEMVDNVIFPNKLYSEDIVARIKTIPKSFEYQTNLDEFINFCIDSINHNSMDTAQKLMR